MARWKIGGKVIEFKGGTIRETDNGKWHAEICMDGTKRRAVRPTLPEARLWIISEEKSRAEKGLIHTALAPRDARETLDAFKRLQDAGLAVGIRDLVDFYLRHHSGLANAWTVLETFEHSIRDLEKPADGSPARPRTIKTKRQMISTFIKNYGGRKVPSITPVEIDGFVEQYGRTRSQRTVKNMKVEIQSLFNHAARWMPGPWENTIAKWEFRKRAEQQDPAEIVTPKVARAVLHGLEEYSPRYALALALGCFAGLRSREIFGDLKDSALPTADGAEAPTTGLRWEDIDLAEGSIYVPARLAKTRAPRRVQLTENLTSWLMRYREASGRIAPALSKYRKVRAGVLKRLELSWPSNGGRHSFGTYYAQLHGYRATADQLGHRGGISMLMDHYSGKCSKAEAEAYFKIMPSIIQLAAEVISFSSK